MFVIGVNPTISGTTCRETQRVSPRQLTSTPAQALQALHGSQNGNGTRSSPNAMLGNSSNNNGNFSLEHPSASPNMVAAASAALSAAAALDPLLQVITMIHPK